MYKRQDLWNLRCYPGMNTSRPLLPSLTYGFWLHWLTYQARYVRVCIPRRAMHASCDSPWHVLAKHCVLGACFPLTTPFRTRFSPCRMARIAHVQGLRGCLYTLRGFHIPTYRFHGTVRACNSPKVTTSLGQRWALGCLGASITASATFGYSASPNNVTMALQ